MCGFAEHGIHIAIEEEMPSGVSFIYLFIFSSFVMAWK